MGNLENGRRVVAWKCPFPATLSKPFLKPCQVSWYFFSNITPVALITQLLQTTEPTQRCSPVKVFNSVEVEIFSLGPHLKNFKIDY